MGRGRMLAVVLLAGLLSACGGGSGSSSDKSFTTASAIAAGLGCSSSYSSGQTFASYNSGQCTFEGHTALLFACKTQADCTQIAGNIDALSTPDPTEKWIQGSNWVVNVDYGAVPDVRNKIGGSEFTPPPPH
jgi:hypothetical protein